MQQAGCEVVRGEEVQQEAVFGRGEEAPCDTAARKIVVAEVDGTFIKAQRERVPNFEVRLGVLYSGKALESATAKYRRYRLVERLRYGGVENADTFGERLFLTGEAKLGLRRARHLLLVGGGAEWIERLAGGERWKAAYQLDWWHLTHAIRRTFPHRPQLVAELLRALHRGEGARLLALVDTARALGIGDGERVRQLQGYLRANQAGFYGPPLADAGAAIAPSQAGSCDRVWGHREADGRGHREAFQRTRDALDSRRSQSLAQTATPRA